MPDDFKHIMCLDVDSVEISGSYFEKEFKFIELSFEPCVSDKTTTCLTADEQFNWLSQNDLQFVFFETLVDIEDYHNPVKFHKNDRNFVNFLKGYQIE
jgi:hypothetical protein